MFYFRRNQRKIRGVAETVRKQILFLGMIAIINFSCIGGGNRKQFVLPKEWEKIDATETLTEYRLRCHRKEIETCPRILAYHDILIDRHKSEASLEFFVKSFRFILNRRGGKKIEEKQFVENNFKVVSLHAGTKMEMFKIAIVEIGTKEFIQVFIASQKEDFASVLPVFEKFWRAKIRETH